LLLAQLQTVVGYSPPPSPGAGLPRRFRFFIDSAFRREAAGAF
jgi:hypothetical protein